MEYRLDLNTLLLMLRQSTGSLYSEIQHIPGVKGRCQVFLRLERGLIKTCMIKSERGEGVAMGETAIKMIQDHVLQWSYTEETPPKEEPPPPVVEWGERAHRPREAPPRPEFALVVRSPIPSRTYPPIPHHNFMLWPRLYRAVYSLIDGKTSIDDIVRLLARDQSKEYILEVIEHLRREGLVVVQRERGQTGWL